MNNWATRGASLWAGVVLTVAEGARVLRLLSNSTSPVITGGETMPKDRLPDPGAAHGVGVSTGRGLPDKPG